MDEYYKKRTGGAGQHGADYQLKILTLVLLKAYKTGHNFKISSESFVDGKLDDVVLVDEKNNFLIQTKHSEDEKRQIHQEALFSADHDLSIRLYLQSFHKLYLERLKKIDSDLQKLQEETTKTNELKLFSKQVIETFNNRCPSHQDVFNRYYQIIEKFENITLLRQIEWFKNNRPLLVTNIAPHIKLIKQKIVLEGKFDENDFFYTEGNEVFYTFEAEKVIDDNKKVDSNQRIPEYFIKYFLKKFQLLILKDDVLQKNMESALRNLDIFNKGRLDYEFVYNEILKRIKAWYQFRKENSGYYLKRIHLEVFFSDLWSNSYVKELREFQHKFHFDINKLLLKLCEKSVTFVNTPRYFLWMVKLQEKWFTEINRGQILFINPEERLWVQQCSTNSFKYHKYTHYICTILKNKNHDLMTIINQILPEIQERKYKKIIIMSEIDLDFINSTDFNKLNDNEFLENLTLTGTRRLKSLGKAEKYYVTRNLRRRTDYLPEHKFLNTILENDEKVILIIDGPGMGKTTLLKSLTCKINQTDNSWAINIELNRYDSVLKKKLEGKNLQIEDFLTFISNNTMQDILESQIFTVSKAIFLTIDAVDEVSPKYTDIVLNLLQDTLPKVAKIVVTSREELKKKLSDSLNVVPYTLESFSKSDQKNCIKSFWIQNLQIATQSMIERCDKYCEILLEKLESSLTKPINVLSIPLQTRMVAEIFMSSTKSEYPGCKQYLENKHDHMTFPDNFNLSKIYDLFIDKKREIYLEKCNANAAAENVLRKEFNEYIKLCKNIAVRIIIEKDSWIHFGGISESDIVFDDDMYKIGLMILPADEWWLADIPLNERLQFIHKSFAEYFTAQIICQKIFDLTLESDLTFPKFLLSNILLNSNLEVVQQFIDSILKNNFHRITSSHFEILTKALSDTTITKECNLNSLAYRGCLFILKLLLGGPRMKVLDGQADYFRIVDRIANSSNSMFNKTALHCAAENGYFSMVEYLVERVDDIDTESEAGLTPLHDALFSGHFEIVKYLIKKGASVTKRTGGGWTMLHYAALLGNKELIEVILKNGANINEQTTKNLPGRTALHISFEKQDFEICEYLLKNGSNINLKDARGWGLWSYAVYANRNFDKQLLKLNLTNREDIKNEKEKFVKQAREFVVRQSQYYNIEKEAQALIVAVNQNNIELIKELIVLGFDINSKNHANWTSLQEAVKYGFYDMALLLLEKGADDTVKTQDDYTIMHLAAACGELKVVKFFHKKYPDLSEKTASGFTNLHLAAKRGEIMVLKYIAEKCDTNLYFEKTSNGKTPLYYAISSLELNVVQFLVKRYNPDLTLQANDGETVLHAAVEAGNEKIIAYIVNKLLLKKVNLNFTRADGSIVVYKPGLKYKDEITHKLLKLGVKKHAIE